ncbi:inositol monophosphatase family protein [Paraburkholderia sp. J12]|uniref:inositol monophosphatase family protein n=1 Tax=Paraburkholderia sp. J12 TaxID=2805432 RepID=UPI002ABE11FE|nr:inositol monophosphatase family protein [Paraburkholderia sp. J12]
MSTPIEIPIAEDGTLMRATLAAVRAAGDHMKHLFTPDRRQGNLKELVKAIHANDAESLGVMRAALLEARPSAGWAEDELESGELPAGEWWVTDPVEGNINHIHGMTEWCVTATLVKDNVPELTVVYLPLTGNTYTATRGGGAFLDGERIVPSAKPELDAALVGTGQARPGESTETFRRIGESVTAMLNAALVVRVSVPATLQLIHVAAGRMDVFWQFSAVRSGLVAGALLVQEAGGAVTDVNGRPWQLCSPNFLASAPALHSASVSVLSTIQ